VGGRTGVFAVIPASKARRESFRKDSGQAGMAKYGTVAKAGVIIIKLKTPSPPVKRGTWGLA